MNPRTRYLVTTAAIVGSAVAWLAVDRPSPPPRPTRAASARALTPARAPLPPTAADVLARPDVLALTAAQRAHLDRLAAKWAEEAAALEAEVAAASEDFARFMTGAQAGGRVRLEDVRARAGAVQERTATLRERRARHSAQAVGALTDGQRARLAANGHLGGGR